MIIGKEAIKLAYAAAKEEKDYYLEQIKKENQGEPFEEYEVNDFIILSEIITPAIEKGLGNHVLDTRDLQKQRVFIMALEAYPFNRSYRSRLWRISKNENRHGR